MLDNYILSHSDAEPEYLAKVNRATHLRMINPRMLSGHFQGRVLTMFCQMIQPKCILELGTFTGYSALCMAEALPEDGILPVSYTHLRAHETDSYLVCRLLLEKKKK